MGLVPEIGLDLGTSNILVYQKGKGIVLEEPSVVAKNISTNKIIAIGYEAQGMIGRTPQNVVTTRPLKDGVISDFTTTRQMLEFIINNKKELKNIPVLANVDYGHSTPIITIPLGGHAKMQNGKLTLKK